MQYNTQTSPTEERLPNVFYDHVESARELERRLAQALNENAQSLPSGAPSAASATDLDGISSRELLQMAYDSVESELDGLRAELRVVRQRHQVEEERLQRRIAQKEALRRKILASAE